jgi:trypsin
MKCILSVAVIVAGATTVQWPALAEVNDFEGFIVGGVPVESIDELPWQVALLNGTSTDPRQFCGGSIIQAQWILTAAHCVEGLTPENVDVLAGTVTKFSGGMRVDARALFIHPNWGKTPYQYDFDAALIKLKEPLTVGAPVALASTTTTIPSGFTVRVSGWGATSEGGSSSAHLLRVDVPEVSNETCNGPQSYNGAISENMICLGLAEGGKDSCQGDSGGPAVLLGSSNSLVGIVSWGWGCAQENYYGVYTRVSTVKDWVDATLAANP